MPTRSFLCACGFEVPLPDPAPTVLLCPNCGEPVSFRVGREETAAPVRTIEREPIQPLPPARPIYPLVFLGGAGLAVAAGLIGAIIYFSGREARRHPATDEPVRYKLREEPAPLSIREVPYSPPQPPTPTLPPPPPAAAPPSLSAPPPRNAPAADPAAALARAQLLARRITMAGIVGCILELEYRAEEKKLLDAEILRDEEEFQAVLRSLEGRPETSRIGERLLPGDRLLALDIHDLSTLGARGFAAGLRSWLRTLQPGALSLATVRRGGTPSSVSIWFPELSDDLRTLMMRSAPGR